MCTVTYIPMGAQVFITSNRDEQHTRPSALPPQVYAQEQGAVVYPKDKQAHGTWIAAHENGNVAVLLNGGFQKHIPRPPYRHSRGKIVPEIVSGNDMVNAFLDYELENIEPFTLVLFGSGKLAECRWDGNEKHHRQLDAGKPYIWSSVTLYDDTTIERRETWFGNWLQTREVLTQESVFAFHQFGGDGDAHNDLRMNRNGKVFTVSITGIALQQSEVVMNYLDMANNDQYTVSLPLLATTLHS
jgi:uncharacterized protein with NRDE domain